MKISYTVDFDIETNLDSLDAVHEKITDGLSDLIGHINSSDKEYKVTFFMGRARKEDCLCHRKIKDGRSFGFTFDGADSD